MRSSKSVEYIYWVFSLAADVTQSLKALALVRLQKVEESLVICDEVLATKPSDDGTLTAMMHVLRALGRSMSFLPA
jgi:hypothetical protein